MRIRFSFPRIFRTSASCFCASHTSSNIVLGWIWRVAFFTWPAFRFPPLHQGEPNFLNWLSLLALNCPPGPWRERRGASLIVRENVPRCKNFSVRQSGKFRLCVFRFAQREQASLVGTQEERPIFKIGTVLFDYPNNREALLVAVVAPLGWREFGAGVGDNVPFLGGGLMVKYRTHADLANG